MKINLKVEKGVLTGKEFNFEEHDTFIFGRSPSNHCYLEGDDYISRIHFLLEINPPYCCIKDLGSLNGTYINGIKYGGREKNENREIAALRTKNININNGDIIKAGETEFIISIEGVVNCDNCSKEIDLNNNQKYKIINGKYICIKCDDEQKSDSRDLVNRIIARELKKREEKFELKGFDIIKEIGVGGMGKVYLANRLEDNKQVAIKTILPNKGQIREKDVAYFFREMNNLKNLEHRNIVKYIEQGYENGIFYFVMEYCNFGSIKDLMQQKGGFMSEKEAIPIFIECLDGLIFMHNNEIVHRDIKPENILLQKERDKLITKISDLGLSKNFQKAGLSGLTFTGAYSGTFSFIPKEQILNFKNTKPVSDIFALGATFYNILTGNYVYNFSQDQDSLRIILEGKIVPIENRNKHLNKKLIKVINKAISPDIKDRYKTAEEMKLELLRTL